MSIAAKHFDTITFDIFDTLVERDVRVPDEIFYLTGQKVLGYELAEDFREKRIDAEKKARRKKQDKEVNISEIYSELAPIYGYNTSKLMEAEIDIEVQHCRRKNKYADLMEQYLKKEKKVFLISDMYLPSKLVKKILDNCKISGYSGMYVSCEHGKNKRSGELFKKVINDNGLISCNMLHYGDSIRADILGAHRAGVRSMLVKRKGRFYELKKKFLL